MAPAPAPANLLSPSSSRQHVHASWVPSRFPSKQLLLLLPLLLVLSSPCTSSFREALFSSALPLKDELTLEAASRAQAVKFSEGKGERVWADDRCNEQLKGWKKEGERGGSDEGWQEGEVGPKIAPEVPESLRTRRTTTDAAEQGLYQKRLEKTKGARITDRRNEEEDFCQLFVLPLGYSCSEYEVTTGDGFILSLQRISSSSSGSEMKLNLERKEEAGVENGSSSSSSSSRRRRYLLTKRGAGSRKVPPVLLQHGLLVGAESWFLAPTNDALPLVLARAGFDVWLGNTRCTHWSRGHVVFHHSSKEFWDWSWDDLAQFDLPASVDFVLNETKSARLQYVGHSQGTLTFLSALAHGHLHPDSIAASFLLCPVAFLGHIGSKFLLRLSELDFDKLVQETGVGEFNLNNLLGQKVVRSVCKFRDVDCSSLITAITGRNCCLNLTRVFEFLPWIPTSTSAKNMAHFAQMVRCGRWQMFDYGPLRNILRYGSLHPPLYNASLVPRSIPLGLGLGFEDALSDEEDAFFLSSKLLGVKRLIELPHYAHLDFLAGISAKRDVYDEVASFFFQV